jgi:hypothetical protein
MMTAQQLSLPLEAATVEYRIIPGYPMYRVGSDGTVWSSWNKSPGKRTHGHVWRKMTVSYSRRNYRAVILNRGQRKRTRFLVHKLVLLAFVGPCPPGMEARHFPDRTPHNNRLENLSWATPKQNNADKIIHGTYRVGEKCSTVKLTTEKVIEARKRYVRGESQRKIAEDLGVSQTNIGMIVRRRTWRHVK